MAIQTVSIKSFGFDCLLFEACNLHCKFCLEAHDNPKINIDYIKQIPFDIFNRFQQESDKILPVDIFSFRFWGGELFFDEISDELFTIYKELVFKVKELFSNTYSKAKLDFAWVTNGVWTKKDRILNLLNETDSALSFSYDPVDRYINKSQEECMINNALWIQQNNKLNEIAITLTKPNINAYISGNTQLDKFKNVKSIDVNYYIANPNWETLLPSDNDLYNFFKWAIDNKFFNIFDIKNIFNSLIEGKAYRSCNCHRHISHCKNCTTFNCVKSSSIFPDSYFYGNIKITEQNVSTIKKQLGMNKRGCLYCDKNEFCPQPCWTSILFNKYEAVQCPFQKIYDYITPEMIEDYKRYINEIRN